jgi:hypothetical protein
MGMKAALLAIALLFLTPAAIAHATDEQGFLNTVAALGYTDTGDAISAGYTVCAMNRSVGQSLTERILRRILNKAADAQDAANAEPFAQAAITYLCPRF